MPIKSKIVSAGARSAALRINSFRRPLVVAAAVCLSGFAAAFPASVGAERKSANRSTPDDQTSVALTVYNDNLGLVKEVRKLKMPRGIQELQFEGVAAQIDPTSVSIRSLDYPKDLSILEQNFEYDLISPAKLMEKYVGRTVELVTMKDNEEVWKNARLIGISQGFVYEMDGKIAVNPPGRVVLPQLPEGLISKPTLIWLLENKREEQSVEASYLTAGISWKCNYVMVLSRDDAKLDVSGWVTLDNRSGATYRDASLKLVAGDVHRAAVPELPPRMAAVLKSAVEESAFEEKAFFEYHLYTLTRPTTVRDNQTKQVRLLDAENVSVSKSYVYSSRGAYFFAPMTGPDRSTKVGVFLTLNNSKANGLGKPLPKGVVRVYKKDDDGSLQFIGEDAIDHTPEDEKIRVKMGEAFDIVGERVQTRFNVIKSGQVYESAFKISLRNHKDEPVVVGVIELIPGDWKIIEKSHPYTGEASNRIRFDVPVPAKGAAELTYAVQIKY